MSDSDDSFINEYIAETREHLADIENDLLTIENGGAAIDEKLVNKVFRAAHSIKGGAGFFNLSKIQDLAHRTENALDLIRSREMVPTPDIINILLASFDQLREMINNHSASQNVDISELVVSLSGLVSAHLPTAQKESLVKIVKVTAPGVKVVFSIPEFDINRVKDSGRFLYLIEYDLIDDVQRRGKKPTEVLFMLSGTGAILEAKLDFEAAGTLDDAPSSRLPFYVLFATELGPEMANIIFDVPVEQIHLIHKPDGTHSIEPEGEETEPLEVVASQLRKEIPAPAPVKKTVVKTTPTQEPLEAVAAPVVEAAAGASSGPESTLRVEVGLLESLMNLAGELVLSRNQLMEAIAGSDRRSMQIGAQRINFVTSELQEAIMLTRMQPVGNIFNKFPRVVRDLARDLGKEVNLEISGREVEMDKTIIEGLSEPLTHMVRNSVDHGIELAGDRQKAGKPRIGTVWIKAYHEAGQVIVEVVDDGHGIDPAKVAASAVSKKLITLEQAKGMSLKEKMGLIFLPGLSTAEKVSGVSGRGVGMDVVKTNLDKLGGKVEIESELGKGSSFIIKLPLTLAIIPSLLVSVNHERFAIPQVHVNELIHVPADQVKKRIEIVGDAEVLVLRGNLIPLMHLADLLDDPHIYIDPNAGKDQPDRRKMIADRRSAKFSLNDETDEVADDGSEVPSTAEEEQTQNSKNKRLSTDRRFSGASGLNIVVMTTGSLQYGLIVDELHDTVEIVVKPLGRHLKELRVYAGATILGDGHVALILDTTGIAQKHNLVSMAGSQRAKKLQEETRQAEAQDRQTFLTFRNAPGEYCAAPLNLVERISQISNEQIENAGGQRSLQYRGASLLLVTLHDAAQVAELTPEQEKVVIVFNVFNRLVGLLAGMPVDVVETNVVVDTQTLNQRGVAGSTIFDGNTTLILDIYDLVETVHPEWAASGTRENQNKEIPVSSPITPVNPPVNDRGKLVLLAEDSEFFRNQVKRYLESDGFTVLAAEDGQFAWELLQANADKVQLVVTDIEMPRMDGLGLARAIRNDGRFAALPVIALSSLAGEEDTARARSAGVNEYLVKLDREQLLEGIQRVLNGSAPTDLSGADA
jgi:two-component system chemotaxis sensor kinase CheA